MALNLSSLANTLLIGCLLLILSSGVSTLQLINFHTFRTSLLKSKCAVSKSETMTLCVCNAVKSNRSLWGLSAGWEECCSPSSSPSQRQPSTVIGQLTQQTVTPSGWQLMLSQPCSQSSLLTSWMYLKTESHRLYLSTLSFFSWKTDWTDDNKVCVTNDMLRKAAISLAFNTTNKYSISVSWCIFSSWWKSHFSVFWGINWNCKIENFFNQFQWPMCTL